MTYYDNLVKHVHAAMQKHPGTPVVMATDNFKIVATGTNRRKIAALVRKCRAEGRIPAVFQKPTANQTFIY